MLTRQMVTGWLWTKVSVSSDKHYRHRIIKENPSKRNQIISELTEYIQKAHEDARNRLRKLAQNPLDPLGFIPKEDPSKGYPEQLHMKTLKGYFGEIFAGFIAEFFSPFGIDNWNIPAHLFRFHLTEFQQLEFMRQTGKKAKVRPGRTGDDCLAFQMNNQGKIISSLYCEAKCTAGNSAKMIGDAHKKVSESVIVDIPQVVEILQDSNDPDTAIWINALLRLQFEEPSIEYERYDLVSYVCRPPARNEQWFPVDEPHVNYTGGRKLEAVEAHIPNIDELVRTVYGKEEEEKEGEEEKDDENLLAQAIVSTKEATSDAFN